MNFVSAVRSRKLDPHRLGQRRARLSRQLRRVLEGEFGARLSGSWASCEGHWPAPIVDRVYSLSDVDVLLDHRPTIFETRAVGEALGKVADSCGLTFAKISVRNRAEIEALWSPAQLEACVPDHGEVGRFLSFWACIGAVEASAIPDSRDAETARAYGLAKFFFKFCRNALLLDGIRVTSYRELADAIASRICDHPAILRAYEIKIGDRPLFKPGDEDVLLSESILSSAMKPASDAGSLDLLATARHYVRRWYGTHHDIPTEACLDHAGALAEGRGMTLAWEKALNDYRQKQCSYGR